MKRSESIANLSEALTLAMGEADNATKDANNPHFKSKYADLASVRDAIRAPFAKHGLSYPQFPSTRMGATVGEDIETIVTVETVLMHKSGEWMSCELDMPVWNADPQKILSAVTYARRGSLAAICGVAPEDDDGNAASARTPAMGSQPRRAPEAPRQQPAQQQPAQTSVAASAPPVDQGALPATAEQGAKIRDLMKSLGVENRLGADALAKELTGITFSATRTHNEAQTLITKLLQRAIDAKQGASNG
jgi:hypothetical protein